MVDLGRLELVPLRSIWPNEAKDFTPWLADNLDVLGQAVGLALELRHREYAVGRYALDLLLEDAQGRVVLVENQLEQTDHGHLGQVLTYCAGTQAEVVIWVAQSMTEEHAAALEWLNANTVSGVEFFGMEVEVLRIGDSAPAPNFKVVVKPNTYTKGSHGSRARVTTWTWEAYAEELRVPPARVEVGRLLLEAVMKEIEERGLAWQPVMNKGYVAIQRSGGYNVLVIDVYWNRAPRLAAKLPAAPDELGLPNLYPNLQQTWSAAERDWGWTIPPGTELPDLDLLFDLVLPFQPASGPMPTPSQILPSDAELEEASSFPEKEDSTAAQ
ncbi:hypothetical protein HS048_29950 [Planomonospora sp. ID91781]|uniref:hypothetical protein n=1 Tax=Planomonospora sp. ID91781 TaxID=2738135 RepID=UPI0018C35952|nr:hypothetical protein [Planomonospora sp. ID91781]MBG0824926.1 hypothetical protein [Planomonospora sp. ID91781]